MPGGGFRLGRSGDDGQIIGYSTPAFSVGVWAWGQASFACWLVLLLPCTRVLTDGEAAAPIQKIKKADDARPAVLNRTATPAVVTTLCATVSP